MSQSQHSRASSGGQPSAMDDLTSAALPGWFVVNLCALAAPLAVPQPRAPELREFRFFVSRQMVRGHECFALHMGFFRTHAEAAKWMSVVRPTYPGASISRLGGQAAPASVPEPMLTDTQVLKVLEVRAPTRNTTETGSYSVRAEERVREPALKSPAAPSHATQTPSAARVSSASRPPRGLEDELHALTGEFDLDSTDSLSATGVRHLRVQVERRTAPRPKLSSARKR